MRAQNYDSSLVEDDVDPSEIFAAYQKDDSHIDIDYLATEHQEGQWGCRRSLCSLLTSPPATCPACRKSGLAVTDRRPPDVQCLSCHWGLSSEILTALEQEFITHGYVVVSSISHSFLAVVLKITLSRRKDLSPYIFPSSHMTSM